MSYTVLARKYRSRTFDEVVGQAPIAQTLVNAIKAGRIHHGYLFTGTRGVGKTSLARILAKSLNCLRADAPTPTPCLECDSCVAIAEGQDIDVVEIDAASNTGVDNIRELRSNAAFRPARARFKVYIIDEVHMLSTGAFNALLKTLEEPPGHVKFILATTEIQKVPATIQSRCQRFNFRSIGADDIAAQIEQIVRSEGATAAPEVIRRVARLANGSMRDALSILDQLLALSPTQLDAGLLNELLPPAHDERVLALLRFAADGDAPAALRTVDELVGQGRTLDVLCNDVVEAVRGLMLLAAGGPDPDLPDPDAADAQGWRALSGRFELSQYVQMISMLEELRRSVQFSGAGRALLDAAVVRLARLRQWMPIESIIEKLAGSGAPPPRTTPGGPSSPRSAQIPAPAAPPPDAGSAPSPLPRGPRSAEPRSLPRAPLREAPATAGPAHPPPPPGAASGLTPDAASRPVAEVAGRPPVAPPQQVGLEERARITRDPLVERVLELFDGSLVSVQRDAPRQELREPPPPDSA